MLIGYQLGAHLVLTISHGRGEGYELPVLPVLVASGFTLDKRLLGTYWSLTADR